MREPEIADEPVEEMFTINSDATANGLLRKLANIEVEKARVQAQAAAIVKAPEEAVNHERNRTGSHADLLAAPSLEATRDT